MSQMTTLDRNKNKAVIRRTYWTRILTSSLSNKDETLEKTHWCRGFSISPICDSGSALHTHSNLVCWTGTHEQLQLIAHGTRAHPLVFFYLIAILYTKANQIALGSNDRRTCFRSILLFWTTRWGWKHYKLHSELISE